MEMKNQSRILICLALVLLFQSEQEDSSAKAQFMSSRIRRTRQERVAQKLLKEILDLKLSIKTPEQARVERLLSDIHHTPSKQHSGSSFVQHQHQQQQQLQQQQQQQQQDERQDIFDLRQTSSCDPDSNELDSERNCWKGYTQISGKSFGSKITQPTYNDVVVATAAAAATASESSRKRLTGREDQIQIEKRLLSNFEKILDQLSAHRIPVAVKPRN